MALRSKTLSGAIVLIAAFGLVACGGNTSSGDKTDSVDSDGSAPTTSVTAEVSPTGTPVPAGTVLPASHVAAVEVAGDKVAILGYDGALTLRSIGDPTEVTVPDAKNVTAIAPNGDKFVAVTNHAVLAVAADGAVTSIPAELPDAISVAIDGDKTLVGTGDGKLLVLDAQGKQQREIGGYTAVNQILVAPLTAGELAGQVVVFDRAQSKVEPVNVDTGEHLAALRAGDGSTFVVSDGYGRISAANTADNEIIGFYGQPIVMRFRYPARPSPYALAYDVKRNLLWVSTTGDNAATAYDLSSGQPQTKGRIATVGQVSAMTVDGNGTLYLASGRDEGLQIVPTSAQNLE